MLRATMAVSATLLLTSAANAQVIDFDELTFDGDNEFSAQFIASPFTTGNFTFTSEGGVLPGFDVSRYLVLGDNNPGNADQGGATLISNREGALNTITTVDGRAFNFTSIDLTASNNNFRDSMGGTVRFYANGNASDFVDVMFDGMAGFQTFTFDQFTAVSSLSFIGQDTPFFQMDNLALAAVPEPATWAMMIAGFGLVGAGMRRRATSIAYT